MQCLQNSDRMGRLKIDWLRAFREYLSSGTVSLVEISNRYGISISRIKKVSMSQKWKQTKDKVWENARITIIQESGDTAEEMIKRHKAMAIFFQETGMKLLEFYLRTTKVKDINVNAMIRMLFEGLKIERELYPRDLIDKEVGRMVCAKETKEDGLSLELDEAVKESFEKDFLLKSQTHTLSKR